MLPVPNTNKLTCPQCKVRLELDEETFDEYSGGSFDCPDCGGKVDVPETPVSAKRCPNCSTAMEDDSVICTECGWNMKTGEQLQTSIVSSSLAAEEMIRSERHSQVMALPTVEGAGSTKTCPFCAEEVKVAAVKCKHCGSNLHPEQTVLPEGNAGGIQYTDIVFDCPHCGKSLAIDRRGVGLTISCVACGNHVIVPTPVGLTGRQSQAASQHPHDSQAKSKPKKQLRCSHCKSVVKIPESQYRNARRVYAPVRCVNCGEWFIVPGGISKSPVSIWHSSFRWVVWTLFGFGVLFVWAYLSDNGEQNDGKTAMEPAASAVSYSDPSSETTHAYRSSVSSSSGPTPELAAELRRGAEDFRNLIREDTVTYFSVEDYVCFLLAASNLMSEGERDRFLLEFKKVEALNNGVFTANLKAARSEKGGQAYINILLAGGKVSPRFAEQMSSVIHTMYEIGWQE